MAAGNSVIVIVGPTGGGKSSLAMELASRIDGEIVCADSRTVYKYMDIGTAKPSLEDQKKIKHHCLDLIEPSEEFSVAEFQGRANSAIKDIQARGRPPIVVGGSGLYIDSLIYGYDFKENKKNKFRELSIDNLQNIAKSKQATIPRDTWMNQRHLASLIARDYKPAQRNEILDGAKIFGLKLDENDLDERVKNRVDDMFRSDLTNEINFLINRYSDKCPGLKTMGYPEMIAFVRGEIDEKEAKRLIILSHKKLIKKQNTWFKRNPDIKWVSKLSDVEQTLT